MYQRVNQLHTIVLGRIVASSDHDTHDLTTELLATQSCKEANAEYNGIEQITASQDVSRALMLRNHVQV